MSTFTQTISVAANLVYWDRALVVYGASVQAGELFAGHHISLHAVDTILFFGNVTVPKGATILTATLSFHTHKTGDYASILLLLYGNDVDSATAPTTGTLGNALVKTTANVDPAFAADGDKAVDVKTIAEEIITRAGWASGNNMQFVLLDNGSSADNNYINNVMANGYTLTIEYTVVVPARNNMMIF
jgi:hypothetical protein